MWWMTSFGGLPKDGLPYQYSYVDTRMAYRELTVTFVDTYIAVSNAEGILLPTTWVLSCGRSLPRGTHDRSREYLPESLSFCDSFTVPWWTEVST